MNTSFDFDHNPSRENTDCVKYDLLQSVFGRTDLIPMWVADMDFRVAPCISRAVEERAANDIYGYGIRSSAYFEAVGGWLERRHGWKVKSEWMDFTPGVVSGLVFALLSVTNRGEGVVIMPPVYPPFAAQIEANGRKVVNNPLINNNGRFEIDFADLDRKLPQAKALLLCNPHNPVGRVFTADELREVGRLCRLHDVAVISDEIHSDLIFKPHSHTPLPSLSDDLAQRTITFVAPSKTFNIAGLSTSVPIVAGENLRHKFVEVLNRFHVDQGNIFGTVAAMAGYNHGDEWLDAMLDYVAQNVDIMADALADTKIVCTKPEGTYLMWLDCRKLNLTQGELCSFFTDRAHVGLNDGEQFGSEGKGFMRINLATSHDVVRQAAERIKALL